jgi:F0F1-type ATP synthase assembly protein I
LVGIILGLIVAKFINSKRWGAATLDQIVAITLGLKRVMIDIRLDPLQINHSRSS